MRFKLLSLNGIDISLNSRTPQCIITGDNIDEIIDLENKMISTIKESGGDNVKIYYVNNCSSEEIEKLKGGINGYYKSRFEILAEANARNLDVYNNDKNRMPYVVYVFPIISTDKEFLTLLKKSTMLIQVDVHIICGLIAPYNNDIHKYLSGYTTRFAFPFKEVFLSLEGCT